MDEAKIHILFKIYENAFNELDTATIAKQYANTFIAAGPKGSVAIDKKDFIKKSKEAAEMYKSLGQNSARLIAKKITPISKEYAMVTAKWGVTFEKTGEQLIEFDISYLIQQIDEEMQVVLFISHQDEEEMISMLGLNPDTG